MENRGSSRLAVGVAMLIAARFALAQVQPPPDAGAVLRETDPTQRPALPPANAISPRQINPPQQTKDAARVRISSVQVVGSTRYTDAEWQRLLADLKEREVTYEELRRAADRVTQRYRADGWFARAYLPEQSLAGGALEIAVIEARVGTVRVEGPASGSHVSESVVRGMLMARQEDEKAVAIDELERAALLVDDLPGIGASIVLAPGARDGETDIVARITNTRRLVSTVSADNSGIDSTGRERLTGELRLESPFHRGDEAAALFNFSEGTAFGRVAYDLPLGADGWRLQPAASWLDYDLGGRFASLDAHGKAHTWSLTAAYPLIRENRLNVRFDGGYEERRYENFALDVQTSQPKVSSFRSTLLVDRVDNLAGGGLSHLSLRIARSQLDLSANAADLALDAATARSNGHHTTLEWSLARLQRLTEHDRLLVSVNGQVASRNLGSSEKMSLGGASGVRAFPELEATGDQGWTATTEWFHSLPHQLRVSLFYDYGVVQQHKSTWTDWNAGRPDLRNRYALEGAGSSLSWSAPWGLELHGAVATRTSRNPARDSLTGDDSDGSRREPQVWFSTQWRF